MLKPRKKFEFKIGDGAGVSGSYRKPVVEQPSRKKEESPFGFAPAPQKGDTVAKITVSSYSASVNDKINNFLFELKHELQSANSPRDTMFSLCKFALNMVKTGVSALLGLDKNQSQLMVRFKSGEVYTMAVSHKLILGLNAVVNLANQLFGQHSVEDSVHLLLTMQSSLSDSNMKELLGKFSNMKFAELPKKTQTPDIERKNTNFTQSTKTRTQESKHFARPERFPYGAVPKSGIPQQPKTQGTRERAESKPSSYANKPQQSAYNVPKPKTENTQRQSAPNASSANAAGKGENIEKPVEAPQRVVTTSEGIKGFEKFNAGRSAIDKRVAELSRAPKEVIDEEKGKLEKDIQKFKKEMFREYHPDKASGKDNSIRNDFEVITKELNEFLPTVNKKLSNI
ncbi:MAG: hypothetical protein KBD37_04480 [Burkholderiales bacterium]|nr:hypothetical protein [Burkholderiales bacterium]